MRYKIVDVYKLENIQRYIAKCLKTNSPQFIIIETNRTLCKELDIIDVDLEQAVASWATGENISLRVVHQSDHLERL